MYKKLIILLISLIVTGYKIISAEELPHDLFYTDFNDIDLFPSCSKLKDPLAAQPIKQSPPKYPRKALMQGVQGTVLVALDLSEKGTVSSSKVIWSSSDDPKYENIFDKNSIRASESFIYQPKTNEYGEAVPSKAHTVITYRIEGQEETLNLGSHTRKFRSLSRLLKKDPDKFLIEVEELLNQNDLEKIQRAIYLYYKGLVHYRRGSDTKEVIAILEDSQKNYYETYTFETEDKEANNIILMGNNESKLHTFNGILLGQLYLEQSRWNEAAVQNATVLRNAKTQRIKSPRNLQAYLNLGISAYNLKLWCQASESWKSAVALSEEITKPIPEWILPYINEANKRRALEITE